MKILLPLFILFINCSWVRAQEYDSYSPVSNEFRKAGEGFTSDAASLKITENKPLSLKFIELPKESAPSEIDADFDSESLKKDAKIGEEYKFSQNRTSEKFHWKPALAQSGIFLGLQHTFRLFQKKTRAELGGKFFKDWGTSVKNLRGWNDGDSFFTNYVAHPIQGAITGRIFVNNSERAKKEEFGSSKIYWESRAKAFVWSTLYSIQFEMGPISEATVGNVGMRRKNGFSTMAWVDLAVTPIVGTGWMIMEDIFEKYVLKNWIEKKFKNKNVIKFFRILLAPTTSFGSILRGKYPWWREFRPI